MNNNQGRRRTRRARQLRKQKNTQISRILLTVGLMALIAVVSIGGTIAWLTDNTEQITNTFTATDIAITLTETPNADSDDEDTANDIWKVQMIPGKEYAKDPVVTVTKDTNVDIYLFVEYSDPDFMQLEYELAWENDAEWKPLTNGEDNTVWYREVAAADVAASENGLSWNLLVGNTVTVSSDLTKEDMESFTEKTMTFKAYAIQKEQTGDAAAAWAKLNP